MANLDLAAIKARLAAATPGPWHTSWCGWTVRGPDPSPDERGEKVCITGPWTYVDGRGGKVERELANADLIESIPSDLSALVERVEEQDREIERLHKLVEKTGPDVLEGFVKNLSDEVVTKLRERFAKALADLEAANAEIERLRKALGSMPKRSG